MHEDEVRLDEDDTPELVHWFDRPPVELNSGQMAALLALAFTGGALAAAGLLALGGRLRD
ncbi:MAG: hypothetical protein K1X35_08265 [Caulobacteraceae bacterium]|nr:hypothetical protein [Caulobacteraceae bacterium]